MGSTNTIIDSNNNLNVLKVNSQTILGITIATGSWLNVADGLSNATKSISDTLTPLANVFSAINSIGDYFDGLLSAWAVLNGVLEFALKMDRFTPTVPLSIVPPSGAGEGFNKLQLNYNNSLALDASNSLAVNTVGFLTPTYGDLGLRTNASCNSYVVVKNILQLITCQSSLNVSGVTTLSNNTTINGILNVTSIIASGSGLTNLNYNNIYNTPSIPNLNVASTFLSSLNVSGFTTLSNNTTINSSLNVNGITILSNNTTINGTLNVSGNSNFNQQ